MSQPYELTAVEALAQIKNKQLGVLELLDSCLARIEALEPDIKAWKFLAPEAARERAKLLDNTVPMGRMHGIPMGVKDILETGDMPSGYGSPIYEGWRPKADCAAVTIAKRHGAIIVGKTVTTELASGGTVKTANPHNLGHTSGGSSAGSCAAVGAKMVPVSFGTQSASSTIRPASYCGLTAMRPSMGLISVAGFKYFNASFDTIGLIARSVDDVELLWSTQLDTSFTPGTLPTKIPRILVCSPSWMEGDCEPAAQAAIDSAARALAAAGAKVEFFSLPKHYDDLVQVHERIQQFEMARSYAYEYENHFDLLDKRVKASVEKGMQIGVDQYLDLMKHAQQLRHQFPSIIGDADAILTNAGPGEAVKSWRLVGDDFTMGSANQSRPWTLLHVPQITLPAFTGPQGLPVGVQLISAFGTDRHLLHTARWAEQAVAYTASTKAA